MQPYAYEPLKARDSIRVLHLLPGKGRLDCSLQETSVGNLSYQALSYVWGDPPAHSHIIIRGEDGTALGQVSLTKNLESALVDLRDSEEIQESVFWIDQICIDQHGTERSSQVAMMGQIFDGASRVITYVGPGSSDDREDAEGIALLNSLYDHFAGNYERFYDLQSVHEINLVKTMLPIQTLPRHLHDAHAKEFWGCKWLAELAYGEWAQRLWIVQEQVLNDEIIMLRGKRCISWDAVAIMNVLFYLDILPHAWLPAIGQAMLEDARINEDLASFVSPWDMTGGVYSLWHDRQTAKRSQQSGAGSHRCKTIVNPLFANLKRFECMKCSNAADRIFALLAISRDANELGIVPDYSKSDADNFRAASMAILTNSKDIRFLNAIARWSNDALVGSKRSSSWAINVPRPYNRESRSMDAISDGAVSTHPIATTKVRFESDNSILVLKGSIVDEVAFATAPAYGNISWLLHLEDAEEMQVLPTLQSSWTHMLCRNNNVVSRADVVGLYMALLMRPNLLPLTAIGEVDEHDMVYQTSCFLRYLYHTVTSWSRSHKVSSASQAILDKTKSVLVQLAPMAFEIDSTAFDPDIVGDAQAQAAIIRFNFAAVWRGRSVGLTRSGKFFSAMNQVQPGDVIVALEGSTDRLWTLRAESGGHCHRLVGDINVPGYMQGEIYKNKNPKDVDVDFRIV